LFILSLSLSICCCAKQCPMMSLIHTGCPSQPFLDAVTVSHKAGGPGVKFPTRVDGASVWLWHWLRCGCQLCVTSHYPGVSQCHFLIGNIWNMVRIKQKKHHVKYLAWPLGNTQ
jgi:hypothetical protein